MNTNSENILQHFHLFEEALAGRVEAQHSLGAALGRSAALRASAPILVPDRAMIRCHIATVHGDAPGGTMFEVRGIAEGRSVRSRSFPATAEGFTEAATVVAAWNVDRLNLYLGVHPRRPGTTRDRAASARDVVPEARCVVVDLDDVPDAEARLRALATPPSYVVRTGTTPHWRGQAWWFLTEPVPLADWSALQRDLAEDLGADASLTDPARVVRLAGTVSWPKAAKRARGYVAELVRAERWPNAPREAAFTDVRAMIGAATLAKPLRDVAGAGDCSEFCVLALH